MFHFQLGQYPSALFRAVPECCFVGSDSERAHKRLYHYRPHIPGLLPPCLKRKLHHMAATPSLREIPAWEKSQPQDCNSASQEANMLHSFTWSFCQPKNLGPSQNHTHLKHITAGKPAAKIQRVLKISTRFIPPTPPQNKRNILWSLNCSQVCNASSSVGVPTHMEKTHGTKCQMYDHTVLVFIVFSLRWFYITPLTPIWKATKI